MSVIRTNVSILTKFLGVMCKFNIQNYTSLNWQQLKNKMKIPCDI